MLEPNEKPDNRTLQTRLHALKTHRKPTKVYFTVSRQQNRPLKPKSAVYPRNKPHPKQQKTPSEAESAFHRLRFSQSQNKLLSNQSFWSSAFKYLQCKQLLRLSLITKVQASSYSGLSLITKVQASGYLPAMYPWRESSPAVISRSGTAGSSPQGLSSPRPRITACPPLLLRPWHFGRG